MWARTIPEIVHAVHRLIVVVVAPNGVGILEFRMLKSVSSLGRLR
jgi:hypothetical protein